MTVSDQIPTQTEPQTNPAGTGRSRLLLIVVAGLLVGLLAGYVAIRLIAGQPLFGAAGFNGLEMTASQPITNFTLTGPNGQPVALRDFRDKVVVIYFGYTYCPDVCPATMAELAQAVEGLSERDREQVQVIMVSVDPARDTPEVLADYVHFFNPDFIGLTGSEEEIALAVTPFGVYYEKHEGSAASGYLVDHTATVSVLDKRGYLRLLYPFGTTGEEITPDLKRLARE